MVRRVGPAQVLLPCDPEHNVITQFSHIRNGVQNPRILCRQNAQIRNSDGISLLLHKIILLSAVINRAFAYELWLHNYSVIYSCDILSLHHINCICLIFHVPWSTFTWKMLHVPQKSSHDFWCVICQVGAAIPTDVMDTLPYYCRHAHKHERLVQVALPIGAFDLATWISHYCLKQWLLTFTQGLGNC